LSAQKKTKNDELFMGAVLIPGKKEHAGDPKKMADWEKEGV
jgi:hypothetical protein